VTGESCASLGEANEIVEQAAFFSWSFIIYNSILAVQGQLKRHSQAFIVHYPKELIRGTQSYGDNTLEKFGFTRARHKF
jgi:hypothetical protein